MSALRRQGYEKALIENYIKSESSLIVEIDDEKDFNEQIAHIFEQDIDGILAVNEIYAAKCIRYAKEREFDVPNDISVIGFTDGLISEYSTPSITSVAQHGFLMGKQAVEMLIHHIENDSEDYKPKRNVISSDLIVRESTKTSS